MIMGKIGGINSSTATQSRKIDKLVITVKKPVVPTSEFYVYLNGKWQHKGKTCRFCGLILGTQKVQDNHQYICKVLNKKDSEE